MKYKNEEQIISIIKYTHPIFILIIGICLICFIYFENKKNFIEEKSKVTQEYIKNNKELIKNETNDAINYIETQYTQSRLELKSILKDHTNNAHTIAMTIYNQEKNSKSKKEIQELIKKALKDMRFNNGRGYYIIYDNNSSNIMNVSSSKDYPLSNMLSLLKQKDQLYYTFFWYKSKYDKKKYKRLVFVKKFKPFNWIIGTGEFLNDYEKDIKKNIADSLSGIRFGVNGYINIFDKKGNILIDNFPKNIEKNLLLDSHLSSKRTVNKILRESTKEGSYLSYPVTKTPTTINPTTKTIFTKYVENLDWVVAAGFYESDINTIISEKKDSLDIQFNKNIQYIFLISSIITLIVLLISLYISQILKNKFKQYKKDIESHITEYKKQQDLLSQQSKMAAMGEMIGNIAHQWRQPLSAITTSATGMNLEREIGTLDNEKLGEGLDNINHAAQHLSQTIEDFRGFFKDEKEFKNFEVSKVINKAISLIDVQFKNHNITIIKDIHNIEIYNIENEIIQVILNILNNARDILIHKDIDRVIFIDVVEKNKSVIINIKDNGGGISEDIISRIFEPYFTTKYKSQGTGIGLYMSKQIIEKHMHGQMSVNNTTTRYKDKIYLCADFKITLPLIVEENNPTK